MSKIELLRTMACSTLVAGLAAVVEGCVKGQENLIIAGGLAALMILLPMITLQFRDKLQEGK